MKRPARRMLRAAGTEQGPPNVPAFRVHDNPLAAPSLHSQEALPPPRPSVDPELPPGLRPPVPAAAPPSRPPGPAVRRSMAGFGREIGPPLRVPLAPPPTPPAPTAPLSSRSRFEPWAGIGPYASLAASESAGPDYSPGSEPTSPSDEGYTDDGTTIWDERSNVGSLRGPPIETRAGRADRLQQRALEEAYRRGIDSATPASSVRHRAAHDAALLAAYHKGRAAATGGASRTASQRGAPPHASVPAAHPSLPPAAHVSHPSQSPPVTRAMLPFYPDPDDMEDTYVRMRMQGKFPEAAIGAFPPHQAWDGNLPTNAAFVTVLKSWLHANALCADINSASATDGRRLLSALLGTAVLPHSRLSSVPAARGILRAGRFIGCVRVGGGTRKGAVAAARACPAAPSACIAAAIAAALTLCVTVCTRPSRVACRCRRGGTEGPATLAAAALVVTPNGVRSAPSAKGRKSSADDPSPSSELLNSSMSAIATYLVSVCLAAGQVARQSSRAQLHVPQPVAVSATGGCCDCHSALLAT